MMDHKVIGDKKGKSLLSLNNLKAGIVLSFLSQPFEVIRTSSIIKNT
jgi:hypothetical protein